MLSGSINSLTLNVSCCCSCRHYWVICWTKKVDGVALQSKHTYTSLRLLLLIQ